MSITTIPITAESANNEPLLCKYLPNRIPACGKRPLTPHGHTASCQGHWRRSHPKMCVAGQNKLWGKLKHKTKVNKKKKEKCNNKNSVKYPFFAEPVCVLYKPSLNPQIGNFQIDWWFTFAKCWYFLSKLFQVKSVHYQSSDLYHIHMTFTNWPNLYHSDLTYTTVIWPKLQSHDL